MSGTKSLSRAAPATRPADKPILLIVAHGERGGDGNDRFAHALAGELAERSDYSDVRVCFISKEPTLKQTFEMLADGLPCERGQHFR